MSLSGASRVLHMILMGVQACTAACAPLTSPPLAGIKAARTPFFSEGAVKMNLFGLMLHR